MFIKGMGVCRVFVCPTQSKVVLVVMSLVRSMAVTVVQVVDVVVVLQRRVTAVRAVLVLVQLGFEMSSPGDPIVQGAV